MNNSAFIMSSLVPVLLMLGIGVLCRKFSVFNREGIDAIKKMVVNICLPAVLVNAFATMEYSLNNVLFSVMMFVFCILAWAAGRLFKGYFGNYGKFIPLLLRDLKPECWDTHSMNCCTELTKCMNLQFLISVRCCSSLRCIKYL